MLPSLTRIAALTARLGLAGLALASAILVTGAARSAPASFGDETPSTIRVTGANPAVPERINLGIGKSIVVDLPRDAKEVFVANPKVANAVVRSSRKVFLIAMSDGATSVFIMDAQGGQIANLEILVGRDMNKLRRTLKVAMPNSA